MGISLGLAVASKWAGFYSIAILLIVYVIKNRKLKNLMILPIFFLIIPFVVYLASYTPFFLGLHSPPNQNLSNFQTFIGLQQQMWWYHTNLKATHAYQSKPFDWIFNLRPVWLYVDYQKESIASIYTLGNPLFMWGGFIAIIFLMLEFIKKRALNLGIILLSYFGFFLPWIFSPRIMFNYHYLSSSVFLAIAIGFTLNKLLNNKQGKILVFTFLILMFSLFIYFYPLWTGVYIDKNLYESYFWLKIWK